MAEKCTKTSSPVDRWMKPNPLAPLNHFTVPFSLTNCSFRLCADWNLLRSRDDHEQRMEPGQAGAHRRKNKMPQRPLPSLEPRWPDRLRLLFAYATNRLLHQDSNLNRSLNRENDWSS